MVISAIFLNYYHDIDGVAERESTHISRIFEERVMGICIGDKYGIINGMKFRKYKTSYWKKFRVKINVHMAPQENLSLKGYRKS